MMYAICSLNESVESITITESPAMQSTVATILRLSLHNNYNKHAAVYIGLHVAAISRREPSTNPSCSRN